MTGLSARVVMVSVAERSRGKRKRWRVSRARGWKGEVNLRSVLGSAWVERGGYVCGWRKEERLGSLRPRRQSWEALWGSKCGGGRCGSWWGIGTTNEAASLAGVGDSPAALTLTGGLRARLVLQNGHSFVTRCGWGAWEPANSSLAAEQSNGFKQRPGLRLHSTPYSETESDNSRLQAAGNTIILDPEIICQAPRMSARLSKQYVAWELRRCGTEEKSILLGRPPHGKVLARCAFGPGVRRADVAPTLQRF
jgi:hypothetical protein